MASPVDGVTLQDVQDAAARLAGKAIRTPVLTSSTLDALAGAQLFFKCEIFQKVGAFKFRGAYNALSLLKQRRPDVTDVVTHSSGNHAQALALAARELGLRAHVVMPRTSPAVKRSAVEGYGARVVQCEPTLAAREAAAAEVLAAVSGHFVHPFNDPDIIAGQGTLALELLADVADLDAIIVPIGGGGMISGVCVAAHGVRPDLRIIAAEPAGADDARRSLAAGECLPSVEPKTIADGLLTSMGSLTWPLVKRHVDRVVTVDDPAIVRAMRLVWERMKIVIEPSAAVGVAVALSDEFRQLGLRRVGVVLCGGNVDLDRLPWQSA